jgi:hypothetical protein
MLWTEFCFSSEVDSWGKRKLWPTAPGTVESATQDDSNGSRVCRVRFAYLVDGKKYDCQQSDFKNRNYLGIGADASGNFTIFDKNESERLMRDFQTNQIKTVYYDPVHPETAFIDSGFSGYAAKMWTTHLALVLCVVALAVYFSQTSSKINS